MPEQLIWKKEESKIELLTPMLHFKALVEIRLICFSCSENLVLDKDMKRSFNEQQGMKVTILVQNNQNITMLMITCNIKIEIQLVFLS